MGSTARWSTVKPGGQAFLIACDYGGAVPKGSHPDSSQSTVADQRPRSGGTPEIFGDISAIERRSRREQVSEELALSEATWHAAFESAPVAIAEVDLEGTIIRANQAMGDLLEMAAGELEGTRIAAYYHPIDRSDLERHRSGQRSLGDRPGLARGARSWAGRPHPDLPGRYHGCPLGP